MTSTDKGSIFLVDVNTYKNLWFIVIVHFISSFYKIQTDNYIIFFLCLNQMVSLFYWGALYKNL